MDFFKRASKTAYTTLTITGKHNKNVRESMTYGGKYMLIKNRKVQVSAAIAIMLFLILIIIVIVFNKNDKTPLPPATPSGKQEEGFTFFGLGGHTSYTNDIRENLRQKLGSDVLETRGTIDLTTNDTAFMELNFPDIYRLNMKLNDKSGARVEHNIIKLTYRYALKKNTPFFYIELVFSDYSKKPLYFKINAKKEGAEIIDEIRKKYGEPDKIEIPDVKETAFVWKRNTDAFVISPKKDRLGYPEFHLMIYFIENIKELISIEEEEREKREETRKEALRKAF
jgi:hypothetical protein